LFIRLTLIAIVFALAQAWRAAAADRSVLEVMKAAAQRRWCSDTFGRFGTTPLSRLPGKGGGNPITHIGRSCALLEDKDRIPLFDGKNSKNRRPYS
jgi:hypothetical protein